MLGREPLERVGVRRVLEEDTRIRIVCEHADPESPLVGASRTDVLITRHRSADEALGVLRRPEPVPAAAVTGPATAAPALVVLVDSVSEHGTRMLLHDGARGILLRASSVRHLPWAVRAAPEGTVALGPVAARFLVDQYVRPGRVADAVAAARGMLRKLSAREREIAGYWRRVRRIPVWPRHSASARTR
ncbi:hypothetical protein [Streptomyces parvulus]|uniref:hypothetical protein n=1 Tax=Streptomyces parvulus TaxID=146923 RepID=UPI003822C79A